MANKFGVGDRVRTIRGGFAGLVREVLFSCVDQEADLYMIQWASGGSFPELSRDLEEDEGDHEEPTIPNKGHPVQVLRPHPEDVWIFQLKEYTSNKFADQAYDNLAQIGKDLGLKRVLLLSNKFDSLTVRREPLTVIEEVAAMREKQISKGYDAEHDDDHHEGTLSLAGAYLALPRGNGASVIQDEEVPPWVRSLYKRYSTREALITATTFLIAEVERIDRAEVSEGGG